MGSLLSTGTKNIYVDKLLGIKAQSGDPTILEDINKISQEKLEYEFEKMYKSSNCNLHPIDFINPCENLSDAIKTCAIRNPHDMTRCFEHMKKYRQCVYRHIHDRLEVYTDGRSDRPYDEGGPMQVNH